MKTKSSNWARTQELSPSLSFSPAAMSPSAPLPLLLLARVSASAVAALVLIWAIGFRNSFRPHSPTSRDSFYYAVLHPLLMVIGLIIVSGEAILIHRWLPGSRNLKKSVHLCMQGVALASGVFGIWSKFHSERGIIANFYSLHSWMGLICMFLFAAQPPFVHARSPKFKFYSLHSWMGLICTWMMGFLNFWHRGEARSVRARVLPWHVFLGLYTYGLTVATAETGLLEKLTFLQSRRHLQKRGSESFLVNGLGLGLALLSGIVILAAVCPRQHTQHSKSKSKSCKEVFDS